MCLAAQSLLPGHDQTYCDCRCALRGQCRSVSLSVVHIYSRTNTHGFAQVTHLFSVYNTQTTCGTCRRERLTAQLFLCRQCKSHEPPTNLHYLQTINPTYKPSHTQHTIILYKYTQLHVSANQIATIVLYM